MIKVFDFFSGCGGTSLGFVQAGLDVVLGLDNDPDAAATFRRNIKGAAFVERDIRTVHADELAPFMQQDGRPVLFSCCAPCQPFSRQSRTKTQADPRRSLLAEFGRFVKRWQPNYIFVENVPGLQNIKTFDGPFGRFIALISKLGYSLDIEVVPALAFGVPQKRERLILMASKSEEIKLPKGIYGTKRRPASTVREWIGDLPAISAGEVHPRDPDHRAANLSNLNLKRIAATPEGGGRESWPKSLWLECHKQYEGHSDVYGRLAWDRPASGLTTRCISYSNGRFGHPEQDRAISIREAACLQTFPRKYRFVGSHESKARQVGNAVPPLMAKAIGRRFLAHANLSKGERRTRARCRPE